MGREKKRLSMAKIPGWAYAGVGAAIAAYAKFIAAKRPSGALTLFFWIGLFLLAIGVFKMVMGFITRKKDGEKVRPDQRPSYTSDYIVCPRCNAKLHPQSRYCNWCGTKQ